MTENLIKKKKSVDRTKDRNKGDNEIIRPYFKIASIDEFLENEHNKGKKGS